MFKVLLVEKIDQRAVDLLGQMAEITVAGALDEATLTDLARDADGMILRAQGKATRQLMQRAPRLKVIARHGVGVDNIDVEAATELGIQVVNTPLANMESVAEHAFGILLSLSKLICKVDRGLRRGIWRERSEFNGTEAYGKTLGIVGAGRVGARVAEIGIKGFDMKVLYRDVVPNARLDALGARRCELDELLSQSDYVSLHVPLLAETDHLISRRELALMKPSAFLLNISRGQVVDQEALVEAVTSGRIAGAGLDVFEVEPLPQDNPFKDMDNVIITPHMASHTREGLLAMAMVVKDVIAVLEGRPPEFPVNHPARLRG